MSVPYITLCEALESAQLQEFIAREEARGIGPVGRAEVDRTIAALVEAPNSEDQTSHSAS
jgi:hypothetical protein